MEEKNDVICKVLRDGQKKYLICTAQHTGRALDAATLWSQWDRRQGQLPRMHKPAGRTYWARLHCRSSEPRPPRMTADEPPGAACLSPATLN